MWLLYCLLPVLGEHTLFKMGVNGEFLSALKKTAATLPQLKYIFIDPPQVIGGKG